MRQVFNISMPKSMAESVEHIIVEGKYASKSEFFRHLLRMWLEGKITKELSESRRELSSGRGKVLKSLKDLR